MSLIHRINATRQIVKGLLDDAEAAYPGDVTLQAIHGGASDLDGLIHTFCQQNGLEGLAPLDGDPKPNPHP